MLPTTSTYIDVYFHRTPPEVLARHQPVIEALLLSKPRITRGTHRACMAKLVNAAGVSTSQVGAAPLQPLARLLQLRCPSELLLAATTAHEAMSHAAWSGLLAWIHNLLLLPMSHAVWSGLLAWIHNPTALVSCAPGPC